MVGRDAGPGSGRWRQRHVAPGSTARSVPGQRACWCRELGRSWRQVRAARAWRVARWGLMAAVGALGLAHGRRCPRAVRRAATGDRRWASRRAEGRCRSQHVGAWAGTLWLRARRSRRLPTGMLGHHPRSSAGPWTATRRRWSATACGASCDRLPPGIQQVGRWARDRPRDRRSSACWGGCDGTNCPCEAAARSGRGSGTGCEGRGGPTSASARVPRGTGRTVGPPAGEPPDGSAAAIGCST